MKFLEFFGCKRKPRTDTTHQPTAPNGGTASQRGPTVPSLDMVIPAAIAEKAMFALIELLRTEAASTEGLFKVSAPAQDVYLLKAEIETELAHSEAAKSLFSSPPASKKEPEQLWKRKALTQPHAAASVLKVYLSQLPEPVLTFEKYMELLSTQDLPTEDERVDGVLSVLSELPEKNKALLSRLMALLHAVKQASRRSHMSSGTLAAVFALEGHLLRPRDASLTPRASGTAAVVDPREARLLQLMIDRYPSMFDSPLSQPSSPKHRRNPSTGSASTAGAAPTLVLSPTARKPAIVPELSKLEDAAQAAGPAAQPPPQTEEHPPEGDAADGHEGAHPPTAPPDAYGEGYGAGDWDGPNGYGQQHDGAFDGGAYEGAVDQEGESGSVREFPGREGGHRDGWYERWEAGYGEDAATPDRASLRGRPGGYGSSAQGSPGDVPYPHCSVNLVLLARAAERERRAANAAARAAGGDDASSSLRMWDTETREASLAAASVADLERAAEREGAESPSKRRGRGRGRSRRRRGAGGKRSDHERSVGTRSPESVVRIHGLPEIHMPRITNRIRQNEALWMAVRRALAEREARRLRRRLPTVVGGGPPQPLGPEDAEELRDAQDIFEGILDGLAGGGELPSARAFGGAARPVQRRLDEAELEGRLRTLRADAEREAARFGARGREGAARALSQRLEDALWAAIRDWRGKGAAGDARVPIARAVCLFPALLPPDRAHAILSVLCALQAERARLVPASPEQSFGAYESPRAPAGEGGGGIVPVAGLQEEDIATLVPILKGHLTVVEMAADGPASLPPRPAARAQPRGSRSPPKSARSPPKSARGPPKSARSPPASARSPQSASGRL